MPRSAKPTAPKKLAPKKPARASSVDARLQRLEALVASLASRDASLAEQSPAAKPSNRKASAVAANAAHIPADDKFWALAGLQQRTQGAGEVVYAGSVVLPDGRRFIWQRGDSTESMTALDWSELSDTLAALAHPVRLRILQRLLHGACSTQDLLGLEGMGTTGQLFHHLKAVQQAGWLRSVQRGVYELAGDRVIPLLVVLSASKG
jgi:DNA-binding transcriptional ArsR family regulator